MKVDASHALVFGTWYYYTDSVIYTIKCVMQEKDHITAHTKSTDKIVLTSSQIYPSRETFYLKIL